MDIELLCRAATSKTRVEPSLVAASPYLQIAEQDYSKLGIKDALVEVLSFKAMVCDRLGHPEERDASAKRQLDAFSLEEPDETIDIKAIWQLVEDVGTVLAGGYGGVKA